MDLTATFLQHVSGRMRAGGLTPGVLAQAAADLLPVDAAGISTLFEVLRLPLGASSRSADLLGSTERRQLELFAAQAAGTLRLATRQAKDATLLAQMEESLQHRAVIDQALGIVMGQQRCTASVAFELLRRESQNTRRRLRDIPPTS